METVDQRTRNSGFNQQKKPVSVKHRLRTTDCRLQTRGKMQTECKMQTAD